MDVLQIGLGSWGKNHARIWGEFKNDELIDNIYFHDINKDLAQRTAKIHGGSVIEKIHDLDIDLVDIVVPANLHFEVAKPFVEKGIKTFIEKPFTDSVNDGQKIIDITEYPENQIMVGHIFRFHNGVELAKSLINKGSIGKVQKIDIRRLAFGVPRRDNGVIFSLAIHDLDLFSYFNNEDNPKYLEAISSKIIGPTEDHVFIKLYFDDLISIAEESWMSIHTKKVRTCAIQGTNGEIVFDFSKPSEVDIFNKHIENENKIIDDGKFTHTQEFKEPLKEELRDFVNKSKENSKYKVGPKIGLRAVKMCEMALEAANTNQRIYFDDFE